MQSKQTDTKLNKTMTLVAGLAGTVGLALVALLGAGSVAAETREAGLDTADACTQQAPPDCFGPIPDCYDMCGDPYCPGYGPLCAPYSDDGDALWLCCPRGYSAAWDDSRGVFICVGVPTECP